MPGMAPPAADERSALLGYLAQARDAFHIVTYGLTDEQAAQAPAASELCIGGLVRHVTSVERYWVAIMQQRDLAEVDYEDNFRFGPDDEAVAQDSRGDGVHVFMRKVMPAVKQGPRTGTAQQTEGGTRARS